MAKAQLAQTVPRLRHNPNLKFSSSCCRRRPPAILSGNSGKQCHAPRLPAFISSLHASLHIYPQTETDTAGDRERDIASQVSCCEFHFRCDILLQNFIFNLCTYYTQRLPRPPIHPPIRWPTYLAFVFIFSEIVLFLPWQLLQIRKAASVLRVRVRAGVQRSVSMSVSTYHLLLLQLGFRPLAGLVLTRPHGWLLIIITGIMTGFHWAWPGGVI